MIHLHPSLAFGEKAPLRPPTPAPSVDGFLAEFTASPHPFGSKEQAEYAKVLVKSFQNWGWKTEIERFQADVPKVDAIPQPQPPEFLKKVAADRSQFLTHAEGHNVVAVRKGPAACAVILSGHYDTKRFTDFRFVGANDGGSSTALLLDVARRLPPPAKAKDTKKGATRPLGDCTVAIVLFDGEEALLPEWTDGQELLGTEDHLYGSRAFAAKISKKGKEHTWRNLPVKLVAVFDMIGHKKQRISITAGSDPDFATRFLGGAQGISIERTSSQVEDDHVPFLSKGIPVLHLIDWTNIGEWHTRFDSPDIVSSEKIERLSDAVIRFLTE